MSYSLVPIVALSILLITHFEVIFKIGNIEKIPAYKQYRFFVIIVGLFYVSDMLWGIFDYYHLATFNYAVTVFYFVLLSLTVFTWILYVVRYLEERRITSLVVSIIGLLFPLFCLAIIVVNFFTPIFFEFLEDGTYVPHTARYAFLSIQMALQAIIAIYSFVSIRLTNNKRLKTRYFIIGFFCVEMVASILLQLLYAWLPLYSLGCAVGVALIKAHVVNIEKSELATSLSKANKQVKEQSEELSNAIELAYSDPLTGAKSKHAYVEFEDNIDTLIRQEEIDEFAVLVFDVNYLKSINDALGHDVGDRYLTESCALIKEFFKYSDVYRYGGDEFIIILEGVDYAKRQELVAAFRETVKKNKGENKPVIATGLSDYIKGKDHSLRTVFNRADKDMYNNKKYLKSNDAK